MKNTPGENPALHRRTFRHPSGNRQSVRIAFWKISERQGFRSRGHGGIGGRGGPLDQRRFAGAPLTSVRVRRLNGGHGRFGDPLEDIPNLSSRHENRIGREQVLPCRRRFGFRFLPREISI